MDLPQPPADQELKNIIDKLAQFVARNGPEFEQMTKSKQKDNPKFSFLFGGDYFNYYQYKVTTEQAIIKHRQQHQPPQLQLQPQQNITTVSSIQNAPQTYPPPIAAYPNPSQYQSYPYPPSSIHQSPYQPVSQSGYPNSQSYGGNNAYSSEQPSSYHQSQQNDGGGGGYPPTNSMPPPHSQDPYSGGNHASDQQGGMSMQASSVPSSLGGNRGGSGVGGGGYGESGYNGDPHYDHRQQQPPPSHPPPPQDQHLQQPPPTSDVYQAITSTMANVSVSGTSTLDNSNYGQSSDGSGGYPAPPGQDHPNAQQFSQTVSMPPPSVAESSASAAAAASVAAGEAAAASAAVIETVLQQQQALQDQIKQSEQNLAAQHQVLQQQKESQVKEGLYVARGEMLKKEAEDLNLVPSELSDLLATITESCTKDSISAGKLWIFTNATDEPRNSWIAQYLNYKATSYTAPFTHKLHIIYLMNDVLHSCVRKGSVELKERLQQVLVPMFCHAATTAPEDKKAKLEKLLSLWKTKLELEEHILAQLHSPVESWAAVEKGFLDDFPQVTHTITRHLDAAFEGYEQQHNAFVQHATTQLQQLEQQKQQLEQQQQQQQQQAAAAAAAAHVAANLAASQQQQQQQQQSMQPPSLDQLCLPPPGFNAAPAQSVPLVDFSKPPPGFGLPPNLPHPDMLPPSQPPGMDPLQQPQMMQQPVQPPLQKENLVPSVPYFELPAGLMCPMVAVDDHKYCPLDPTKIRLPPPAPPTERLLRAVENFYLPPSHERPRNSNSNWCLSSEGWEQLSLYDYYKSKSEAVKRKADAIEKGDRDRSQSPDPVLILPPPPEKPETDMPVRRYRSVSPEKEEPENNNSSSNNNSNNNSNNGDTTNVDQQENRSPGRSPGRGDGRELYSPTRSPRSERRSPRRSPVSLRRSPRGSPSRRSPPSFRRSPPSRRSPRRSPPSRRSPRRTRSRSLSPRSRSRSRSASPGSERVPFKRSPSRSPSPPSFGAGQFPRPEQRLSESNKGHQMLRKMGWGGTGGLGLLEQGIENPIDAGEVRDNPQERFRGLGIPTAKNDPFEAFRKNKGKAFITRMKARAEEKL